MEKYSSQTHRHMCEQPLCNKRKEHLKTKIPIYLWGEWPSGWGEWPSGLRRWN